MSCPHLYFALNPSKTTSAAVAHPLTWSKKMFLDPQHIQGQVAVGDNGIFSKCSKGDGLGHNASVSRLAPGSEKVLA